MRTARPLSLVCLLSTLGCRSREAEVHAIIERAASDIDSGTSDGIKLAICGFRPGSHVKLRAEGLSVKLSGEENGSGEMSAALVADSGLRCEGTATFTYGRSPNKGSSQHYYVRNFERVGPHGPVVAAAIQRARDTTLGTPIDVTVTDDWPLLPETSAAALVFQIPRDGRYSFVFPRTGAAAGAWFVAYQDERPVQDRSGGISEISLAAGLVTILVLAEKPGNVVLDARPASDDAD